MWLNSRLSWISSSFSQTLSSFAVNQGPSVQNLIAPMVAHITCVNGMTVLPKAVVRRVSSLVRSQVVAVIANAWRIAADCMMDHVLRVFQPIKRVNAKIRYYIQVPCKPATQPAAPNQTTQRTLPGSLFQVTFQPSPVYWSSFLVLERLLSS